MADKPTLRIDRLDGPNRRVLPPMKDLHMLTGWPQKHPELARRIGERLGCADK